VYVNKLNYIFTSPTSNATSDELGLWRSIDGGAHWVTVYYDSNARHIHCITVDPANNYVYASIGDVRAPHFNGVAWVNWNTDYVIRSTDDGVTWSKIVNGDPQILAIATVDATASNGTLYPVATLLATDFDDGIVYRTTNDVDFTSVLDTGSQSYGFW
jgi:hypothetical protein